MAPREEARSRVRPRPRTSFLSLFLFLFLVFRVPGFPTADRSSPFLPILGSLVHSTEQSFCLTVKPDKSQKLAEDPARPRNREKKGPYPVSSRLGDRQYGAPTVDVMCSSAFLRLRSARVLASSHFRVNRRKAPIAYNGSEIYRRSGCRLCLLCPALAIKCDASST